MFRFFLKLAPVGFLVFLVVMPVYDWIAPVPFASQGLSRFDNQLRVCVGVGSHLRIGGGESSFRKQRTYLLFPRALRDPSLVSVTLDVGSGRIATDENAGALWFLLAVVALCAWATWRWWVRPIKALGWQKFREAV